MKWEETQTLRDIFSLPGSAEEGKTGSAGEFESIRSLFEEGQEERERDFYRRSLEAPGIPDGGGENPFLTNLLSSLKEVFPQGGQALRGGEGMTYGPNAPLGQESHEVEPDPIARGIRQFASDFVGFGDGNLAAGAPPKPADFEGLLSASNRGGELWEPREPLDVDGLLRSRDRGYPPSLEGERAPVGDDVLMGRGGRGAVRFPGDKEAGGGFANALWEVLTAAPERLPQSLPEGTPQWIRSIAEGVAERADYYQTGRIHEDIMAGKPVSESDRFRYDLMQGNLPPIESYVADAMEKLHGPSAKGMPAPEPVERREEDSWWDKALKGLGSNLYGATLSEAKAKTIGIPLVLGVAAMGAAGGTLPVATTKAAALFPAMVGPVIHGARLFFGLGEYGKGARAQYHKTFGDMETADGQKFRDVLSEKELDVLSTATATLAVGAEGIGLDTFYRLFPGVRASLGESVALDATNPLVGKAILQALAETAQTWATEVGTEVLEEGASLAGEEVTTWLVRQKGLEAEYNRLDEGAKRLLQTGIDSGVSFFLSTFLLPGASNVLHQAAGARAAQGNLVDAGSAYVDRVERLSVAVTGRPVAENLVALDLYARRGDDGSTGFPLLDMLLHEMPRAAKMEAALSNGDYRAISSILEESWSDSARTVEGKVKVAEALVPVAEEAAVEEEAEVKPEPVLETKVQDEAEVETKVQNETEVETEVTREMPPVAEKTAAEAEPAPVAAKEEAPAAQAEPLPAAEPTTEPEAASVPQRAETEADVVLSSLWDRLKGQSPEEIEAAREALKKEMEPEYSFLRPEERSVAMDREVDRMVAEATRLRAQEQKKAAPEAELAAKPAPVAVEGETEAGALAEVPDEKAKGLPSPVGRYARSGSVSGRVVSVLPNGDYRLEGGLIVTPWVAENWAEQTEPFVAEPPAQVEPDSSPVGGDAVESPVAVPAAEETAVAEETAAAAEDELGAVGPEEAVTEAQGSIDEEATSVAEPVSLENWRDRSAEEIEAARIALERALGRMKVAELKEAFPEVTGRTKGVRISSIIDHMKEQAEARAAQSREAAAVEEGEGTAPAATRETEGATETGLNLELTETPEAAPAEADLSSALEPRVERESASEEMAAAPERTEETSTEGARVLPWDRATASEEMDYYGTKVLVKTKIPGGIELQPGTVERVLPTLGGHSVEVRREDGGSFRLSEGDIAEVLEVVYKGEPLVESPVATEQAPETVAAPEAVAAPETVSPAARDDKPFLVRVSFGSYNPRRYSRPWGARVTFGKDNRPQYSFDGNFLGDDDGGDVVINARPGEIVAVGQKDKRGGRSENDWYVVGPDGALEEISRADALSHVRKQEEMASGPDAEVAQVRAEVERIMAEAGVPADQARASAELYAARARAVADRYGVSPLQWLRDVGLAVESEAATDRKTPGDLEETFMQISKPVRDYAEAHSGWSETSQGVWEMLELLSDFDARLASLVRDHATSSAELDALFREDPRAKADWERGVKMAAKTLDEDIVPFGKDGSVPQETIDILRREKGRLTKKEKDLVGSLAGGHVRYNAFEINSELRSNKAMREEIERLQRSIDDKFGVAPLVDDEGIVTSGVERRESRYPSGETNPFRPRFGGFARSFAQTFLDNLPNQVFEQFRSDLVRAVEHAYANGGDGIPGVTFMDRGLESVSKSDFRVVPVLKKAEKTVGALNLNSNCPMFMVGSHGCYLDGCYVTGMGASGNTINFYSRGAYTGELLQLSQEDVDLLNSVGGLRLNGQGDLTEGYYDQLHDIVRHAKQRGLKLKVISKQDATVRMLQKMHDEGTDIGGVQVQLSIDPYWIPIAEDELVDSMVSVQGLAAANRRRPDNAQVTQAIIDLYAEQGREAAVIDGVLMRKYGFSVERASAIGAENPDVQILQRVVVGTPEEIVYYAREHPEILQTWMHAAVRGGMYSDVAGRILDDKEIGNFTARIAIYRDADGEWHVRAQQKSANEPGGDAIFRASKRIAAQNRTIASAEARIAEIEGAISRAKKRLSGEDADHVSRWKAEIRDLKADIRHAQAEIGRLRKEQERIANKRGKDIPLATRKAYSAVEEHIKAQPDAEQIFATLAGSLEAEPSALCCSAGADKDACNNCTSHCHMGSRGWNVESEEDLLSADDRAELYFQTAFHGSPYRFSRFSLDHIGTGEGAQAYGWGLYFAGEKDVAEYYREGLAGQVIEVDGKDYFASMTWLSPQAKRFAVLEISNAVHSGAEDAVVTATNTLTKQAQNARNEQDRRVLYDANNALLGLRGKDFQLTKGQLYEVDIPESESLLDWDKPLEEQGDAVRAALAETAERLSGDNDAGSLTGEQLYKRLAYELYGDRDASEYLNDLGIKGIRYLDGSSRGRGEGTHNYVIFDDAAIDVLETFYQNQEGEGGTARGQVAFRDGQSIISLFKGSDKSTLLHETGHVFLQDLRRLATKNEQAASDLAAISRWLGVEDWDQTTTEQRRRAHEQFAEGFEAYLREGKAPSSALRQAFESFRQWLTEVYRSVREIFLASGDETEINDEVRQFFDRMLATEQELQEVRGSGRESGEDAGGTGGDGRPGDGLSGERGRGADSPIVGTDLRGDVRGAGGEEGAGGATEAETGPRPRFVRRDGRIAESRAHVTAKPDLSVVPEAVATHLRPHQQKGAALAIAQMKKGGGFLLADGTGIGKTREILATASALAGEGRPVIIVAPAGVISPQWKKGTIGTSSYRDDGAAMGVSLRLSAGDLPKPGEIVLTTYEKLGDIAENLESASSRPGHVAPVVVFDEAHYLKNATRSRRAKRGISVAEKAHAVLFATATPVDKAEHLSYLARAGLLEGKSEDEQMVALGMRKVEKWAGNVRKQFWVPATDLSTVYRNMEALFDRVTASGQMIQRELSLADDDGAVKVNFTPIPVSTETLKMQNQIRRELGWSEHMSGLSKAHALMHLRRQLEAGKVPAAAKLAKEALDKGRQVVVFASRINRSEVAKLHRDNEGNVTSREVIAASDGTLNGVREALIEAGVSPADIVEISGATGGGKAGKSLAMDRFQSGKAKVALATVESGGTGINLDDTTGDSPRTMIIMSAPFSAVENVQAIGRVWRLNTKSFPEIHYLVANAKADEWNIGIIENKVAALDAVVQGRIAEAVAEETEKTGRVGWHEEQGEEAAGYFVDPSQDEADQVPVGFDDGEGFFQSEALPEEEGADPRGAMAQLDLDLAKDLGAEKEAKALPDGLVSTVIQDLTRPETRNEEIKKNRQDPERGQFAYLNEEHEEAHRKHVGGEKSKALRVRLAEWLVDAKRAATRAYKHLPHDSFHAEAIETLRRMSFQLDTAQAKALRFEKYITSGLDQTTIDLFNRLVVLDDFAFDANEGLTLPFGISGEEVQEERVRLLAHIKDHAPEVLEAVAKRRRVWRAVKDLYLEEAKKVGIFGKGKTVDEVFTRGDAYFRHRVLKHVREEASFGSSRQGVRGTKNRGWLKQRKGSAEAINLNYFQAEFEVLSQMLYDTATFEALNRIKEHYDISTELKAQAEAVNEASYVEAVKAEAIQQGKAEEEALSSARQALDAVKALPDIKEKRRIMEERVRKAGLTYYGPRDWQKLIPDSGQVQYEPYQAGEGQTFYKAWSIPERMAKDLLDGVAEEIGLTEQDLRSVIAKAKGLDPIVIPSEIAAQLREFGKAQPRTPISKANRFLIGAFKRLVLFSPKRAGRYFIRNFSGDVEGPIVGNIGTFRHLLAASDELGRAIMKGEVPKGDLALWMELGGLESGLSSQELGEVLRDDDLARFYRENETWAESLRKGVPVRKTWDGYWRAVGKWANFQESLLRYATFRSYLEQMRANEEGRPKNFGASNREFIMGLSNISDRAYHLSNDLLVAYDMISEAGKEIRQTTIPFWSFMEGNLKRYWGLARNAWLDGETAAKAGYAMGNRWGQAGKMSLFTAISLGRFALRAVSLLSAVHAFNNFFFPEEEEKLPMEVRTRPHIILPGGGDDEVVYFDRIGALGDALGWVGLDAAPFYIRQFLDGKMSLGDVVIDMAKSPVNKLVSGYNPFVRGAFELLSQTNLFPDAFKPRQIKDRAQHVADMLTFGDEFRAITGRPMRGGTYFSADTLRSLFSYAIDPGEAAYWEVVRLKYDFLERMGNAGPSMMRMTPRTKALWNYKRAIRYKDADAAEKYGEELMTYMAMEAESAGKKLTNKEVRKAMDRAIESLSPLSGLSKAKRKSFLASLTPRERDLLKAAEEHYRSFYLRQED